MILGLSQKMDQLVSKLLVHIRDPTPSKDELQWMLKKMLQILNRTTVTVAFLSPPLLHRCYQLQPFHLDQVLFVPTLQERNLIIMIAVIYVQWSYLATYWKFIKTQGSATNLELISIL